MKWIYQKPKYILSTASIQNHLGEILSILSITTAGTVILMKNKEIGKSKKRCFSY